MADPTLSTTIFRRSILAAAATAATMPAVPALPAIAESGPGSPDPDAALFRRIAVAEHWRNQHARACRLRDRLWQARMARTGALDLPGVPPSAVRKRHDTAGGGLVGMRWSPVFWRYAEAVRAAIAVPAHTIRGARAKLGLALIAARRGDARIYLYEDHDYMAAVLADLDRIAGRAGAACATLRPTAVVPGRSPPGPAPRRAHVPMPHPARGAGHPAIAAPRTGCRPPCHCRRNAAAPTP